MRMPRRTIRRLMLLVAGATVYLAYCRDLSRRGILERHARILPWDMGEECTKGRDGPSLPEHVSRVAAWLVLPPLMVLLPLATFAAVASLAAKDAGDSRAARSPWLPVPPDPPEPR